MELKERIINDTAYHPPSNDEVKSRHEQVRDLIQHVSLLLVDLTVPGREQSTMLTKLEEAMFWANASIARNQ